MPYDKLILLAPCHGLEDFPLYHTGDDAASFLACWTALWHPLFIEGASSLPRVERCDYPPEEIDHALLLLPHPCEAELDPDLPKQATEKHATLIRGQLSRPAILQQALEPFGDRADAIDTELVQDFLAFGYAFWLVEILTQQMRYASSIDQTRIHRDLREAANAAIHGDADRCREKLTACHDALADERSHYYPIDVMLVDLTLLATSEVTLGPALDLQLRENIPQNLLASGDTVEKLASGNAAAVQRIRQGLASGTISVAGGEYQEKSVQLLSLDALASQLEKGRQTYLEHLGEQPDCFARRKNGLYPSLANVAHFAGYETALHIKFDEGRIPESDQGKTKWQVGERDVLETYARCPLDASQHETFLNLPTLLSDTMDSDHVAARMFIHWPGYATPWYDDLRRCARYGTAIGKFVTLRTFFSESADYSTRDAFAASAYSYPTLDQSVAKSESDSITKWANAWADEIRESAASGLETIRSIHNIESNNGNGDTRTVVNPFSFARRIPLVTDHTTLAHGPNVYASATQSDGSMATLVDVPAMGFASVRFGSNDPVTTGPDLGSELTLRNEFFQAEIDPHTGTLRSLKDYRSRRTRLSQQIAFRITLPKTGQAWVDRQAPVAYSVMAADTVEMTHNGKIFAEITTRGRMLALNGEPVGTFIQRYQVTRGSRVLVVEAEISTDDELLLEDEPWDSYYAFRFAFGDESALMRAGSRLQMHDVSARRFEAPLLVEIDCGKASTTILTGGLPFHRRVSLSQLDTLLAVSGEKSTRFRIGIGVDLPTPTRSAIDFIASAEDVETYSQLGESEAGWFFHIDAKNVIATRWKPLEDNQGVQIRLVETDFRRSKARIRSFKPWKSACVINAAGDSIQDLTVDEGVAAIEVEPHAFLELRLRW